MHTYTFRLLFKAKLFCGGLLIQDPGKDYRQQFTYQLLHLKSS